MAAVGPLEHLRPDVGAVRCGDAFDLVMALDDGTVDAIVTSPPYWGLRSYGHDAEADVLQAWERAGCPRDRTPPYEWYRDAGGVLGLEPLPQWYIDHLVEFFARASRVLADSGSVWINLGDTYFARWSSIRDGGRQGLTGERRRRRTPSGGYLHDKQMLLIPARFAIAMQDAGWVLRNDLIWAKPHVLPRPEADRPRHSHEHWFHFVKRSKRGRPSYYYDMDATEPGSLDVVTCHTAGGEAGHSATFPLDIVLPRIRSICPPGGVVLDPFCGTGVALEAAVSSGRRVIGFELSANFAAMAASRVAAATSGTAPGARPSARPRRSRG